MNNKVTRNGIHQKNYIRSVSVDGRRQRNVITKGVTMSKRKMVQAGTMRDLRWRGQSIRPAEHLIQHEGST